MSGEKVVSLYSRRKPIPMRFEGLRLATAAASLLRRGGVRVLLEQGLDNRFILIIAA